MQRLLILFQVCFLLTVASSIHAAANPTFRVLFQCPNASCQKHTVQRVTAESKSALRGRRDLAKCAFCETQGEAQHLHILSNAEFGAELTHNASYTCKGCQRERVIASGSESQLKPQVFAPGYRYVVCQSPHCLNAMALKKKSGAPNPKIQIKRWDLEPAEKVQLIEQQERIGDIPRLTTLERGALANYLNRIPRAYMLLNGTHASIVFKREVGTTAYHASNPRAMASQQGGKLVITPDVPANADRLLQEAKKNKGIQAIKLPMTPKQVEVAESFLKSVDQQAFRYDGHLSTSPVNCFSLIGDACRHAGLDTSQINWGQIIENQEALIGRAQKKLQVDRAHLERVLARAQETFEQTPTYERLSAVEIVELLKLN